MKFAPLIRVSTEKQEKQGESLRTQRTQVINYVKNLGGSIPEMNWQYSGQEHATSNFERIKLQKLLQDSRKGLFDAVIVVDASRWSRDNRKSKEGLQVLRDNGIKFYVGTSEFDLYNPEHIFFLGMTAEFGEFQARQQTLKSITNRIERAKQGIPTTGKLPFGRLYDRKTHKWSIDPEAQKKIKLAADSYLKGEQMSKIATALGMNHPNLWKILTKRSGCEWIIKFKVKKLNVDEQVTINIPPLLPPETIKAILEKSKANKTYTHGQIKNKYLLARAVFCAECGNAMFGQTNHNNRRYYRHPRGRKNNPCNPGYWVRADQLEEAIIIQLYAMFGNPQILKDAVERATPNSERIEELKSMLTDITKDISVNQTQINNLVRAVAEGTLPNDTVKEKMEELKKKEEALKSGELRIQNELDMLPDYKRQLSKLAIEAKKAAALRRAYLPERLPQMTYEEKRELVQIAFAGKDMNGKRLGVYVQKNPDGNWHYEVRGIVHMATPLTDPTMQGVLPMAKGEAQDILCVETDYTDFNPLEAVKEGVTKYSYH